MPITVLLNEITIRTGLQPGDLGYIVYLHGHYYHIENNYGLGFEAYVAEGLAEFYRQYDAAKDCIWICEHNHKMIGCLVLMHRPQAAQLRYFFIAPGYRGIGLGRRLMDLYMSFLHTAGYRNSYLWTTEEQEAATRLYRHYGFQLTEQKTSTTFGKPLYEQRYEWCLE